MKTVTAPPPEWVCGVRISLIPKSGEPYIESFDLPLDGTIAHWGQEYALRSPVRATVEVSSPSPSGEKILAKIGIGAEISLPCSRCLRETGLAIAGDLRYLFTLRSSQEESDGSEQDGDVDLIPVDAFEAELNLIPWVWEVLLLSLPERALCSEDCKGLCPVCGADRNEGECGCREDDTDPRFAALRNFQPG